MKTKLRDLLTRILIYCERRRLRNTEVSIIANNCVAGVIYSDFKMQFLSPTINLYFFHPCFMKFVADIDGYLDLRLEESSLSKYGSFDYPVGKLGDVEIHFMHYHSFEEASESWVKRAPRINKANIRIIDVAREGWVAEDLDKFQQLPYKKVLFFNHSSRANNVVFVDIYKKQGEVGEMIADGKPWYYYMDLPFFLSTGEIRKRRFLPRIYKVLSGNKFR